MEKVGILLTGHGSKLPYNKELLEELASSVEKALGIGRVEIGLMEFNSPSIEEGLAKLAEGGAERVIVIPVFMALGKHTIEDIPAILGMEKGEQHTVVEEPKTGKELEIYYDEPLGKDERISEIVIDRINKYLEE